jgi:hypothetical protein
MLNNNTELRKSRLILSAEFSKFGLNSSTEYGEFGLNIVLVGKDCRCFVYALVLKLGLQPLLEKRLWLL